MLRCIVMFLNMNVNMFAAKPQRKGKEAMGGEENWVNSYKGKTNVNIIILFV